MKRLHIHEAKTHLSRLVAEVEQGEQFVLCRAGKPVACLSQYHPAEPRKGGQWKGLVRIGNDFDARCRPTSREPFGETANEAIPSRHPRHSLVALGSGQLPEGPGSDIADLANPVCVSVTAA